MSCEYRPSQFATKFPACFQTYSGVSSKKNPGNVQSLHALAHRVMPKFFDGVELDYVHRLAPNKALTAAWILSHNRASGFRFGGLYTFRIENDMMMTPTIVGDIHPSSWAANLNILYYPFRSLRLEGILQKANEETPVETQYTAEWSRNSDTWTCNLYNVSAMTGRCTLSMMRAVSEHWALGAELLLEWSERKKMMADIAFAARYSHHNYSFAATASRLGLDVSYWQRIHPSIQMANMLAWNRNSRRTIATICYQWDFSETTVRGMVDSELSVGFMYLKYLSFMPCQVGFSLIMHLPTDRFAFGMKFVLDPSGMRRGDLTLGTAAATMASISE